MIFQYSTCVSKSSHVNTSHYLTFSNLATSYLAGCNAVKFFVFLYVFWGSCTIFWVFCFPELCCLG